MKASELIEAMEEGRTIRKFVNPEMSRPQVIDLLFTPWKAGGQRVITLRSNYPIRPSSRDDYRQWLSEAIERPEEWEII
jgi:hypothetical protein